MVRLQRVAQSYSVQKQATTTLSYLHTWSKLQAEIRARRMYMVTEGRLRQKKLENKLNLEAKLHDLEVEWSGGPETMEEILSRLHQREKAAVKRQRAMAYSFSHQWRANPNPISKYELGKADWGWSWKERRIAARPWEILVPSPSISPKKVQHRQARLVKIQIHQHQNHQFQLNPLYLMGRELQRLEGGLSQMPKNHLPVKGTLMLKKKAPRKVTGFLVPGQF